MGNRLKDLETSSLHSQLNRHPTINLPPNDLDLYATAIAGNTLAVFDPVLLTGTRWTMGGTPALLLPGWGGASTVHFVTGGTLGAGKAVVFRIEGRDENWDRVSENVTVVGDGATVSLQFVTVNLYSEVISVAVVSITGTLLAGETFAIGIGNGTTSPAIRIPQPISGLTLGGLGATAGQLSAMIVVGAAPSAALGTTSGINPTKHVTMNYAANNNVRQAFPVFRSLDRSVLDRS